MTLVENENTFTLLSFYFHNQKEPPKCFYSFLHFHCFLGQIITWRKFSFYNILVVIFIFFTNNAIEQLKKSDIFILILFGIRLVMRKSRPNIIKFDYPLSTWSFSCFIIVFLFCKLFLLSFLLFYPIWVQTNLAHYYTIVNILYVAHNEKTYFLSQFFYVIHLTRYFFPFFFSKYAEWKSSNWKLPIIQNLPFLTL